MIKDKSMPTFRKTKLNYKLPKMTNGHKIMAIKLATKLSLATIQAKRQWNDIFKVLSERNSKFKFYTQRNI